MLEFDALEGKVGVLIVCSWVIPWKCVSTANSELHNLVLEVCEVLEIAFLTHSKTTT
jgi:hypothetical protein